MNEVSYGRVTYFEPNNLFGGNNMPVNQEDLTKYVNLSVRIPSRFYNESAIKKNYDSILKGYSFNEKINNKDYTKFYLTDNYVNVTYTEFGRDNEINNGELFGIESINISFDVQFQPIVSINFIDVKGYGLMSTMEYNYEEGKVNNLTAKSFFTSLFNFPYPIFTLEIKGYYGRNVSLDLALKDFHTSFDSQSGNFITNVTFIGHLYGVYGDIPMLFLMVSPFLDNCKTWNGINDESNIPTYLELLTYYKDILSNGSFGEFDSSFIYFTNKQIKLEELKTVERLYENIFKESEVNISRYRINENNVIELATTDKPSNIRKGSKAFILKQESELNLIASYSELKHGITNRTISSDYNMTFSKSSKYESGEFSYFSIDEWYNTQELAK